MRKSHFTVSQFMTPAPHTILVDLTLDAALRTMEKLRIRHLPVLAEPGGRIVGLLSFYDARLIKQHAAADREQILIREVMDPHPYCANPETLLGTVATAMAERHLHSCLIVQSDGSLIGIFTYADALATFARMLQQTDQHLLSTPPRSDPSLTPAAHRVPP